MKRDTSLKVLQAAVQILDNVVHWNSLGAKSAKARRHESHSCAVSGDSKYTFLIPA